MIKLLIWNRFGNFLAPKDLATHYLATYVKLVIFFNNFVGIVVSCQCSSPSCPTNLAHRL